MRWCDGSLSRILSLFNMLLIVYWWSWWESHPCLKSYWTTSCPARGQRFKYIYNDGFKNWPRKCSLRPLPCWKSFLWRTMWEVLVLRYLESLVCELLTNRHHHSSVCGFFPPQPSHITFLPQSLCLGELPLASVYETSTTSEPPYQPENA